MKAFERGIDVEAAVAVYIVGKAGPLLPAALFLPLVGLLERRSVCMIVEQRRDLTRREVWVSREEDRRRASDMWCGLG
eukprot:CAMPEP_0181256978 /NCGR_PEP_ID=MMETSP1096-20121128/50004_1 /TAXON_ID=156174 ORGANISM="Chrysochromulina ericina, Strain CCMP281" /NCGR_SAMPLE_ID=MMETSP1096 /ASSEMBLY_ACC=CAM_ASM_000453 /LENGTH=77 /DNA_ID=CAMNT_0023355275 /DNA_START=262 /DNA_END=492 /DNA_ORIENTATION=+